MDEAHPFPAYLIETGTLGRRKQTRFDHRANTAEYEALIAQLDLIALRKLSFAGSITPAGRHDWALTGTLGATAVQACTITLEPVTTRIEVDVARRFVAEMPKYSDGVEEDEFGGIAMLDDDSIEPLERDIDLWRVLTEALALALPDYPRSQGAELGMLSVTEPGKTAMSNEDAKPFAGLAALKDKLGGA